MQELQTMQENKTHNCWVCNKPIIPERAQFLIEEGVREDSLTCTVHSQTKRLQALYSGEHGTSDLILCDKVYNDSVRTKFHEAAEETSESSTSEIDDG